MGSADAFFGNDGRLTVNSTQPASSSMSILNALVADRQHDYEFLRNRGPVQPPGHEVASALAQPRSLFGASSRSAPVAQKGVTKTPSMKKYNPADDPDMEPIWRYSDGSYMTGAEAPVGAQNAAFTGFYRKRPTGGGSAGSVNPTAANTSKWQAPPGQPAAEPWSLG